MRKCLDFSLTYAVTAMVCGVFYREFTKYQDFTGVTALCKGHAHLVLLGVVMFRIVFLFAMHWNLDGQKKFRWFLRTYNIGVPLTAAMLLVRGVTQVLGLPLTTGASAAMSGIAGIGHILTGVGLILLLLALRDRAKEEAAG